MPTLWSSSADILTVHELPVFSPQHIQGTQIFVEYMNEWFLNYTNDNWGLGILNTLTKVLQQSSIRIST